MDLTVQEQRDIVVALARYQDNLLYLASVFGRKDLLDEADRLGMLILKIGDINGLLHG